MTGERWVTWCVDAAEHGIERVADADHVDAELFDVHPSFTAAKQHLLRQLRGHRYDYGQAAADVAALRKVDV